MRIAFVSVGIQGFGHNVSFPPNAVTTVAASVYRHFGHRVVGRIFDEVLLGHDGLKSAVKRFQPEALLISVPVTGYYPSAVDIAEWAKGLGVPVLLGGYHFTILGNGSLIPREAVKRLRVPVCHGQGEETVVRFVEHVLDPNAVPLRAIPNIHYWDAHSGRVERTEDWAVALGSLPFPALPMSWHDPRAYWEKHVGGDVQESGKDTLLDGRPVSRTIVGPRAVLGCRYRTARIRAGKEACSYCTLTSEADAICGSRFWQLMRELWDYVETIGWDHSPATCCYQIGDTMGSDVSFIRSVWECRPSWQQEAPLAHRLYAWGITNATLARMLRDINVRWLYIGADGKEGFTSEWSERHPLVRTLRNCRAYGLSISLGYVLGRRGQSWEDLRRWEEFHKRIIREFADVLIVTHGFPLVVAPGSPDWDLLLRYESSFGTTDEPDLEMARLLFWKDHTRLCAGGETPDAVRRRLFEIAWGFEFGPHTRGLRTFMLPP